MCLYFAIYCTRVYYITEDEPNGPHNKRQGETLESRSEDSGTGEAIERALDGEHECSSVLQLMAACRGALNGLVAEVLEGHIRFHVLDPNSGKNAPQGEAAEELIDVVRTYLK
jgi:DNA-binding FrmR family transcriptional regulator